VRSWPELGEELGQTGTSTGRGVAALGRELGQAGSSGKELDPGWGSTRRSSAITITGCTGKNTRAQH
jgi:hypothetical protein